MRRDLQREKKVYDILVCVKSGFFRLTVHTVYGKCLNGMKLGFGLGNNTDSSHRFL